MLIPVRCFSCGTVVGDKFEEFERQIKENPEKDPKIILDELNLRKVCCRRMIISQVNLIDTVLPYNQ